MNTITREDLLKSARKLYESSWPNDALKKALEESFPELRESEDERIRKTLLRCCDDWDKGQFGCMKKEDIASIRAYLEKQKEQNVIMANSPQLKEQKPNVEYVYPKFRVGDEIVEVSPNGYCPPVIIKYIREGRYSCESKDRKRFLSFPIKNENEYRLIEQKPAEWSEEDEMAIKSLISYFESKTEEEINSAKKTVEWLKSLRPQPHWKPSEEQMKALAIAIRCGIQLGTWEEYALKSLYYDLKSLLRPQNN